jgi:hypothetical protein
MANQQEDILDPLLDLGMLEDVPAWKLSSRFLVSQKYLLYEATSFFLQMQTSKNNHTPA